MPFPPGREDYPPASFDPPPIFIPIAPPRPAEPTGTQLILLLLTIVTTTMAGGLHYVFFELASAPGTGPGPDATLAWLGDQFADPVFYLHGLWYSVTVLAILGCHEMGHYVYCLRHGVDASRPYFLPVPLPLTGTLGAFIRIRSRIPSKLALFDIGIAGPIAGFAVAVPALVLGMRLSNLVPFDPSEGGTFLGEPPLFRLVAWATFGDVADGLAINMHPVGFAAWFGLIATALNLFPFGQLDGGHIMFAVFGRRSTYITIAAVPISIALVAYSWSWLLSAALIVLMVLLLGPQHPPTLDDSQPLGRGRLWLAAFALVMLVLCFTPAPIEPFVEGR